MNYSVEEILKITGGQLLNKKLSDYIISDIYFDTRRGSYGTQTLFLAIDGKNADGHQYIDSAYHKLGTRNFLVSKKIETKEYSNANFILTENVTWALQKLAVHHRKRFSLQTIGITGSNGKTIVKEWIYQLCEDNFNVVRSPGSYNSQIGVPLSVLRIEEQHDLAIFEAGISGKGEMEALAAVIQPDIGIFTNIGEAHSAGFRTIDEKVKEKMALFSHCQKVIYCQDHEEIHKNMGSFRGEMVSWSTSALDVKYIVNYEGNFIKINHLSFEIPYLDEISRMNATFAIITALELGMVDLKTTDLKTLKMRLEMKQGINNCFLINDSYSSDFNSLSSALQILEQQQKKSGNALILSQIEESNLAAAEMSLKISDLISQYDIQHLIAVGPELKTVKTKGQFHYYKDTEALLSELDSFQFENQNILIKGARKFNLEQIFDRLSVKVHQTILEIDLESMRHNLMIYRSLLGAETKLMVVLKASGYGSGSRELSRFLAYQRVDYIAVAYVDEGVELRKSGIETPIMVMNPEESGFSAMIKHHLEPEIYSLQQLRQFASYVEKEAFPIHLKIETGMHRLGLDEVHMEDLCQFLKSNSCIKVASVFSHLVGSDDPALDAFSHEQVTRYLVAYQKISSAIGYKPDRHILNSSGISRFGEYQYEMVRLGIGLHGFTSDEKLQPRLQKVQTLKTRIAQIKEVKKGETVGYNRMHVSPEPMKIATINIGYADGLPRNAGNGRYNVLVNGQAAPIVGNVCMDMCMIVITDITAEVGDEVVIFGQDWPIEALAKACDTIPYEILTRLSSRIHRIFSRE